MLTPTELKDAFEAGLDYACYVATGTADQQASWKRFHGQVALTADQRALLGTFTRRMPVLVISGTWCGDCVQQVPMFDHVARASGGAIDLRLVDRDVQKALSDRVKICGGNRVPTVIFMNEDFEFIGLAGDKSLSRFRALAARSLGAACMLPGASIPKDEIAATVQDWVNEFERCQWLLRLSAKLRERHGD
jgi:thioredoxin-like negative regulator of GroEL